MQVNCPCPATCPFSAEHSALLYSRTSLRRLFQHFSLWPSVVMLGGQLEHGATWSVLDGPSAWTFVPSQPLHSLDCCALRQTVATFPCPLPSPRARCLMAATNADIWQKFGLLLPWTSAVNGQRNDHPSFIGGALKLDRAPFTALCRPCLLRFGAAMHFFPSPKRLASSHCSAGARAANAHSLPLFDSLHEYLSGL